MAPVPWRRLNPKSRRGRFPETLSTPCLEGHPIWSVPHGLGAGGSCWFLVSCWVSQVANCFVVAAEIGGILGGSSQLVNTVNNHGDRKSLNWGS